MSAFTPEKGLEKGIEKGLERATLADSYEDAPNSKPLESIPPLPTLHQSVSTLLNNGDITALHLLLSPSSRLQESKAVDARGIQGYDAVALKLVDVISKMSGAIQNPKEIATLMRSSVETRSMLTLKKGFITLSLGLSITWKGGFIKLIVLSKSAPSSFMTDNTEAPSATEPSSALPSTSPQTPLSSTTLLPPFLVPRPTSFPPPTVTISLLSCSNLTNAPMALRPVNSYAKIKLPSGTRHQTKVVKMTSNPTYKAADNNTCSLAVTGKDEYFDVQILDWKPVKHRLLGEFRVSLGAFSSKSSLQTFATTVDMRWKKSATAVVNYDVVYEDVEQWWQDQELAARDEKAKMAEEEEKEASGETKGMESESANCVVQ